MTLQPLKIVITIAAMLFAAQAWTQTDPMKGLSAKERAERARQEQMEASQDDQFLLLMDSGHSLFRAKKYLKSIHSYEQAGQLRPLNVYPPVIIRDIELSMRDTLQVLREQEAIAEKQNEVRERPELPDREKEMEEFHEKEKERQKNVEKWEDQQRRQLAHQRALKKDQDEKQRDLVDKRGNDVGSASVEELQKDLAEQYSQGVSQRTYNDDQRVITERIVVKGDKGNEYKRVEHPWGGKFYFKNGSPISEETWNQETNQ